VSERPATWPHALLAGCGGFLLAVLWMDLMFDVQVRAHAPAPALLPEATLASIAGYYRRVTTDAHPMQRLIALVMGAAVVGSVWTVRSARHRALGWLAVAAVLAPVALAGERVVPNAVRLGMRVDPPDVQSALARAILADHVLCFVSIAAFVAIEIALAAGRPRRASP
jgi:hypothetical protein